MQSSFVAVVIGAVSLFLTSGSIYMYVNVTLILINQWLLNVVFSITEALNGQISPKQHFHYPHFLMLFGKICFF